MEFHKPSDLACLTHKYCDREEIIKLFAQNRDLIKQIYDPSKTNMRPKRKYRNLKNIQDIPLEDAAEDFITKIRNSPCYYYHHDFSITGGPR